MAAPMAIGARRRDHEPLLDERAPVRDVEVDPLGLGARDAELLADLGVVMTLPAGERESALVGSRARVTHGEYVVRPVTECAAGVVG